jgi:putative membrane protein
MAQAWRSHSVGWRPVRYSFAVGRSFVYVAGPSPSRGPAALAARLVVNAGGLALAAALVPGIEVGDWQSLVAGTAIFAIVNMLLRPLALALSCCLVVATFGLFVVVVNAAMLGATAWAAEQLGLNFRVEGFWSAIAGALVISAVSLAAQLATGAHRGTGRRG